MIRNVIAFLTFAAITVVTIAFGGCAVGTASVDRVCTPDAFVICNCGASQSGVVEKGTKHCKADGLSFEACLPCSARGVRPSGGGQGGDDGGVSILVAPDPGDGVTDPSLCPGIPVKVQAGTDTMIVGDTTKYLTKTAYYQVTPPTSGNLTLTARGPMGSGAKVCVRRGDCISGKLIQCSPAIDNGVPDGGGVPIPRVSLGPIPVVEGEKYYYSIQGGLGEVALNLHFEAHPFCGDGKVDVEGEECDEGYANSEPGSTCTFACELRGDPPSAGLCDGQPLAIWANSVETVKGSTAPFGTAGFTKGSCGGTGPIHVYALKVMTALPNAKLRVRVKDSSNPQAPPLLYARSDCAKADHEIACNGGASPAIVFPVFETQTTALFVQAAPGAAGDYTLEFFEEM